MSLDIDLGNQIRLIERLAVEMKPWEDLLHSHTQVLTAAIDMLALTEEARSAQGLPYSLKYATTDREKKILEEFVLPIRSMINTIIEKAIRRESPRSIEVIALCIHGVMDQARETYGVPYDPADYDPSVYGEAAGK